MYGNPSSRGWRSRGYIPHFDAPGFVQFITFRLADAVPQFLIDGWKKELKWAKNLSAKDPRQAILRQRIEKYEDAGHGACWLRNEAVAELVQRTILFGDGLKYRVIAWCVMPNHDHTVIAILQGHLLEDILQSWKSYTAHMANKILQRSGKFWFREYHDRYIRDERHLNAAVAYVENNPVKAGLVAAKEHWIWSSAWTGKR